MRLTLLAKIKVEVMFVPALHTALNMEAIGSKIAQANYRAARNGGFGHRHNHQREVQRNGLAIDIITSEKYSVIKRFVVTSIW